MLITKEIRNKTIWDYSMPLSFEQVKHYQEYFALAVLRYTMPEKYNDYQKVDAPDLQCIDRKSGVEVTSATAENEAAISGDFVKYRITKDNAKRSKLKQKIELNGGKLEQFGISYPVKTGIMEYRVVRDAILQKNKKLPKYIAAGFDNLELFVNYAGVFGPWSEEKIRELIEETREKQTFDAVYICSSCVLIKYQYSNESLQIIPIPREDYEALGRIARMTVTGEIDLKSSIWTKCEE